ncbi:RHS repeat-associated core domain-containing protein [Shewanella algae]
MLTDASGYQVWQAEFDSFGRLLVQAQSQIDNPLRFPGQYYDQESGLHYNWHRYYDAETGRYISSDPIGLYGGMNFYAYVGGNPLMRFDPMGLFSLCDILNVIPDVLKGTLKLGLGTGLGVSGDLTISEKGISGSVFAGIAVGAVGSWKSKVTSDLTSISGNWGGTKGGFNVGTKLQGYAGYGLVGSVAGEFGTNGMTLSGSVDVGAGAFGGVGFVVSGPILDCTIYDEC